MLYSAEANVSLILGFDCKLLWCEGPGFSVL